MGIFLGGAGLIWILFLMIFIRIAMILFRIIYLAIALQRAHPNRLKMDWTSPNLEQRLWIFRQAKREGLYDEKTNRLRERLWKALQFRLERLQAVLFGILAGLVVMGAIMAKHWAPWLMLLFFSFFAWGFYVLMRNARLRLLNVFSTETSL
ncbi:MAG: hypothetical protein IKW38_04805 [Kiritimatiellae bacterium]|nr:hypothetical protein [Kiritimatiellia bacterium]